MCFVFQAEIVQRRPYTKQLSSGQRQMLMDKIWLSVADLTEGPEQADLAGLRQLAAAYKVPARDLIDSLF